MKTARLSFLAVVASVVLRCTPADAKVVYVDGAIPDDCHLGDYSAAMRACVGSDGSGYRTFAPAVADLEAGDVLIVRGGTYTDPLVVTSSGTAEAHLRIAAYPGESPVIDLGALAPGSEIHAVSIISQSYVDIDGLHVLNSPYYGVKVYNANHITFTNFEAGYSTNGGVVFDTSSNVVISGCNVHHNNVAGLGSAMEAVSLLNVNQFQVTNCDVHDNGKEGIDAKYGTTGGLISENRAYANHGPNIYMDAANNIRVSGNICHTTAPFKACIGLSIESGYNVNGDSEHDILIDNNVIYGSGAGLWFWVESLEAPFAVFSNIRIEYNTIADNSLNAASAGVFFLNGSGANFAGVNIIRNNIIWNNGGTAFADNESALNSFTVDHNLFLSYEFSSTVGTSPALSWIDPFVDHADGDFRLVDWAPARGVGQPEPDITTDLLGTPRPSDFPDVGAYQYPPVLIPAAPPVPDPAAPPVPDPATPPVSDPAAPPVPDPATSPNP